jgi:hypothetical protein
MAAAIMNLPRPMMNICRMPALEFEAVRIALAGSGFLRVTEIRKN